MGKVNSSASEDNRQAQGRILDNSIPILKIVVQYGIVLCIIFNFEGVMKKWIPALMACSILLSGCSQSTTPINVSPTPESPTATISPPTHTPTQPPVHTQTATFTQEAVVLPTQPIDQEALKVEWTSVIQNASILTAACEGMFETHTIFQLSEIDIDLDDEEEGN